MSEDFQADYLSKDEIKRFKPYTEFPALDQRNAPLVQRLKEINQFPKAQAAGRRWPVGCVSLEITQRCNLDCSLCYLSEHSEAVKDIPLQEIFRRIDVIYRHYGKNTDIQVSGGDPTLRDRAELIQIVERIAGHGMQCSLLTNGIKATRDLLTDLAKAGLTDVAFHVDLTQERKGYATEVDLNKIRLQYIERARGLGLNVFFNTTVYAGNFKEIPQLVKFFKKHANVIDLASFQIQADTGRGVLRERDFLITQNTVIEQIEKGAEIAINFDIPMIGHPKCNKKATMFEINQKLYNMTDRRGFIEEMISVAPVIDRSEPKLTTQRMFQSVRARPYLWPMALRYLWDILWPAKVDLFKARGKVNKLTIFIHNFMDASKLERDRIHGCVFMVATQDGPISMCMYNAKRDDYLLQPLKIGTGAGEKLFHPLTGKLEELSQGAEIRADTQVEATSLPFKNLKGRSKQQVLSERQNDARPT